MKTTNEHLSKPDKKLAAVCGLFCPSCTIFIAREEPERLQYFADRFNLSLEETKCYGCRSEKRLPYCESCKMVPCAAEKGVDFCGECDEYPCQHLKEFQAEYPHRIELWESQARIKEVGYEQWFEEMVEHYSCPECQTVNSAYDIKCRKCETEPGCAYVGQNKEEIMQQLSQMK